MAEEQKNSSAETVDAAASRKVIAGKALKSAESSGRNHSLRQHTASGMADIDAQTCHKRIDLL